MGKTSGLSAAEARQILDYDPESGIFRWKSDRSTKVKAGQVAGSGGCASNPYSSIKIDKVLYKAHRLAWLISYGWLPDTIDHIDGDPRNNKLSNLRECTMTQNLGNQKTYKNNKSGFKGVFQVRGRWRSYVQYGGKRLSIGYFDSKEEAAAAYIKKASELFGEFARAS